MKTDVYRFNIVDLRSVKMPKMIYKKCSKCGKAIQVMKSGAGVVTNCELCGGIMEEIKKREFDRIRGYDKIRDWIKEGKEE